MLSVEIYKSGAFRATNVGGSDLIVGAILFTSVKTCFGIWTSGFSHTLYFLILRFQDFECDQINATKDYNAANKDFIVVYSLLV